MRVLGLIPARGGSKGVPRKNLADVGGRPLIAFPIETGLTAERIDRLIVSTDDEEIADVARSLGAEVPFLRPPELADDAAPMISVAQHALQWSAAAGETFDAVCLLQPTSPLRTPALVDTCIGLLRARDATSVVTVRPVPHEFNPAWTLTIEDDGFARWPGGGHDPIGRRQDLPPAFHRDGLVYVTRSSVIEGGSLYGDRIEVVSTESIPPCNVDTAQDLDELRSMVGEPG